MCEVPTSSLQRAIRDVYGCASTFVAVVPVVARFDEHSQLIAVTILRLLGHPTAKHCYAWSHRIEAGERNEYVLVLEAVAVNSPESALLASGPPRQADTSLRV